MILAAFLSFPYETALLLHSRAVSFFPVLSPHETSACLVFNLEPKQNGHLSKSTDSR